MSAALKRARAVHDRITKRLDGKALKRLAELNALWGDNASITVPSRDLRSVLALAKETADLKRRVRLARVAASSGKSTAYRVLPLLDLRRALPKRRGIR